MKFNKKIAVPFLSTVMGLSLIGGVGGAVAWYQYNSRVTASFIGTSVANTGVLQIGQMKTVQETDPETGDPIEVEKIVWGRDLNTAEITGSTNNNKLAPVTFGELVSDPDHEVGHKTYVDRLPSKAYTNPEAGKGPYQVNNVDNWNRATVGKEFVQFDVYLQALVPDANAENGYKLAEKDVYLSQIVLADAVNDKSVSDALRVHLAMNKGVPNVEKNILISKVSTGSEGLNLWDQLDLDADGKIDTEGGWAWNEGKDNTVTYGTSGQKQYTKGIDQVVLGHDAAIDTSKLICKTSTDAANPTKITVTVWLEGWHKFDTGKVDPQTSEHIYSSLWDPTKMAGYNVNVGLEFDARSFEA